MATLGNTGASSLIKSASSIANAVNAYNDKVKAYEWDNSAQTDADYQEYASYLNSRIEKLNNTGTLTSASQAVTMLSTLKSARRSYASNVIQRAQQDVMTGNATTSTKLNVVGNLYNMAVQEGDINSAQNLYSQILSLNQQIQNEAETAQKKYEALQKKNAASQAKGFTSYIDQLEKTSKDLLNIVKEGGTTLTTSKLKDYAKNLGVDLPEGSSPNIGSLIQGAMTNIRDAYAEAGQVYENIDAEKSNNYYSKADDITNDVYNLVGMNYSEANAWARDPSSRMIVYTGEGVIGTKADGTPITGAEYKTIEAPVVGYNYDSAGNIQNVYSTDVGYNNSGNAIAYSDKTLATDENLQKQVKAELGKLVGQNVYIDEKGNILVNTDTKAESQLLRDIKSKYGVDKSTPIRLVRSGDGYQIKIGNQDSQKIVTLAKDLNGQFATYEQNYDVMSGNYSYNQIGTSDTNYNQFNNSVSNAGTGMTLNKALATAFSDYANMKQGYTESNIIPDIAKNYFSGDVSKAAAAVYSYRKPFETTSSVSQANIVNNQNTIQSTANNVVPVSSPLKAPTISNTPVTINTALQNAFKNYKTQPKFYTENVIIKDIAKQYYNNDINAASTAVYKYRKQNFGE